MCSVSEIFNINDNNCILQLTFRDAGFRDVVLVALLLNPLVNFIFMPPFNFNSAKDPHGDPARNKERE